MPVNLSKETVLQIHVPEVTTPDACVTKCSTLPDRLGEASLSAIQNPDSQYAVVCARNRRRCGAMVMHTGHFVNGWNPSQPEDEAFLPNPGILHEGTYSGKTTSEIIVTAKEAGALEQDITQIA